MPSAEPARLTDYFWLAAHDSVSGKPRIGEWPMQVGLATGLLAELVHGRFLELRQGELFRTTAALPDDPALCPLLIRMEAEEQSWKPAPQPPLAPASRAVAARHPQTHEAPRWPAAQGWNGPTQELETRSWRPPTPQQETRHRRRGHQLGTWLSCLAREGRTEERVIDRLSRTGLVRRQERRRLWGGAAASYLPYNSVAAAIPASMISVAVWNRRRLDWSQLILAGLFLATGLHHHALATMTPSERSHIADQLRGGLDEVAFELLCAADAAVSEAAVR
jgi:hypothetical protein